MARLKTSALKFILDDKDVEKMIAEKNGYIYTCNSGCPMARAIRREFPPRTRISCRPDDVSINGESYRFDDRGQTISSSLCNGQKPRGKIFGLLKK